MVATDGTSVEVRAYNEGIAFRYHFPETANSLFLHVTGEQTSFSMPAGTIAWYEEWAQGPYQKRPLVSEKGKVKSEQLASAISEPWFESERPLLMQLSDGTYIALLEAAMKDYTRGKFKLAKDNVLQVAMYDCADIISPYDTPWRVIMAGEKAVDLINHKDLVLNLNTPSAYENYSLTSHLSPLGSSPARPFVVVSWRRALSSRALISVLSSVFRTSNWMLAGMALRVR